MAATDIKIPEYVPEALKPFFPQIVDFSQVILQCLLILIVGWIISKWAKRWIQRALERSKMEAPLAKFLAGIGQYIVLIAAGIAVLGTAGIETTSVVAVLGSAGIAVGLALQGNLSHFASGVMILFFQPFTEGDVITAGGQTGAVQEIGLFATVLHTPDNMKIIVPNASITGGTIVNITTLGTRRGAVSVGVAYGADVEKVVQLLTKAAQKTPCALQDPGPAVAFVDLGASSINFSVMAWSKSEDYLDMLHNLRTAVYDALNEAEIEIPYDQIVVHKAP